MYVELQSASAFSFLEGASLPERLVERAAAFGYDAIALLDRDGVYGAPRFFRAATELGVRPIFGASMSLRAGEAGKAGKPSRLPCQPSLSCLPVLVATQAGYRNLCRLITQMKLAAPKGEGAVALDDLDGAAGGLVALAGRDVLLRGRTKRETEDTLDRLVGIFGRSNVFVGIQRHLLRNQEAANRRLRDLAAAFHLPVVATGGVRFAHASERPLFDVLTCVRHKTDLAHAGQLLAGNSERALKSPEQMAQLFSDMPDAVAASRELAERLTFTLKDLGYRFPIYPVPSGETAISHLRVLTDRGARDRYRPYHEKARRLIEHELAIIEKLDLAGYFLIVWDIVQYCREQGILVQGRGSAANSAVCYSLGITAVDAVKYGMLFERFLSEERGEWPDIDLDLPSGDRRERVIQHVYDKYGRRGAAMTANVITYRGRSAAREVGKALGLEAEQVDRLAKLMNNFEFTEPGDPLPRRFAEIGWSTDQPILQTFARLWHQIQDLPRHLGQHSGGMVICQNHLDEVVPIENASMPDRTVIQWDKDDCADMGIVKVDLLGLGMMAVLEEATELVNRGTPNSDGDTPRPRDYARGRGRSTVSVGARGGGAPREVNNADRVERIVEAGSDRLRASSASASLAEARSSFARAEAERTRPTFDLAHLPENDPAVYELLRSADTIGVFQVESRAQMATLPRLSPRKFYDLVVEVAIIRPGPIVGQMVHPYLNRRAGREPVVYPHPSLEPILNRTLGVPLFQEQLLRIAMVAAGFNGGQAEDLRRAMGFKRSEQRMKKIEVQLREGMARNGITGATADQIITSITSFALYGFPESHAISFALLAYASAYLKVYYPEVFYTALLNNQPMGFYHPSTLVKEAQRRGVHFAPIDVERSDWSCSIEAGGAAGQGLAQASGSIRLGLRYVNGLRAEIGKAIAARGRDRTGARFKSVDDLTGHVPIRRDELNTLASIGALNSLGYERRSALWQVECSIRPSGELFQPGERMNESEVCVAASNSGGGGVPAVIRKSGAPREPQNDDGSPVLSNAADTSSPLTPMTLTERLRADYAGTGLTLGRHPMALRRDALNKRGVLRACDLRTVPHGRAVKSAGAVITRQRPGTAKGFVFMTLEDETGLINVIIHPKLFAREWLTIVEQRFLYFEGVLQNVDNVINIRAERITSLAGMPELDLSSHDFH